MEYYQRIQGRPTHRRVKRILTFLDESSDSYELSSEMWDINEQLSAIMAQLTLMNSYLKEQDKEIKTLREIN